MHFEISEAKNDSSLLMFFLFLLVLYAIGHFFDLDYLKSALPIAIGSFFGSLPQYFGYFEMYNLQVASSEFQVLKKYAC
jgi:hypothetical protein